MISLALFQFSGTMHLKSLSEPGFVRETLNNVTVSEGRDVLLSCTVKNLGGHKVRMNFHRQIIIHFIDLVIKSINISILELIFILKCRLLGFITVSQQF